MHIFCTGCVHLLLTDDSQILVMLKEFGYWHKLSQNHNGRGTLSPHQNSLNGTELPLFLRLSECLFGISTILRKRAFNMGLCREWVHPKKGLASRFKPGTPCAGVPLIGTGLVHPVRGPLDRLRPGRPCVRVDR